jgi:hypothetical protein
VTTGILTRNKRESEGEKQMLIMNNILYPNINIFFKSKEKKSISSFDLVVIDNIEKYSNLD